MVILKLHPLFIYIYHMYMYVQKRYFPLWSQYSVREDYTERVQLHRRELTKTLIEARNQGKYALLRFDKLIIDGDTYMYNDTDDTIKRIGSSKSRGRVGANNGLQRLDASRGNDDVDTRATSDSSVKNTSIVVACHRVGV